MSTHNVALIFGLVLLQATFIKDALGQNSTCQILDLAFLIDGSGSICLDADQNPPTCGNWEFIKAFVYRFVNSLNISSDTTRVAVVTFANNADLLWGLTKYLDKISLLNAINDTWEYPGGNTNTTGGLMFLVDQVFVRSAGDRSDVSNTAIIITDGKPTNNATVPDAIQAVHNANIRTLVVGVTDQVDNGTLKLLSSPPQVENVTYFWATSFSTIDQVRAQLYTQTCSDPNPPIAVTPTPATAAPQTACDLMDLCFIVDRSGSICDSDKSFLYTRDNTCGNWAEIVNFIYDFVNNYLNIGPSNVRVALVTFDNSAELVWGLAKYTDKSSLLNVIKNLQYIKGGTTNTTGGLNMARTQVFNTPDDRSNATNVAIIITDGKPTVPSTVPDAIKELQGGGCRTLAVGVTDSIDVDDLRLLSSPPKEAGKTYFMAPNYTAVVMMSASIQAQICPQPNPIQSPQNCTNVQDLAIVLDGSGSICDSDPTFNFTRDITCKNWKSILQFLHNVIAHFIISPTATRVALILFSDNARLEWGLDGYTDNVTLLYAIDNLQYIKGGTTNMTGALKVLNSQVFTPRPNQNATKTAIIVTDGKPTVPSTVPAAIKAVQDSGIRCLVVGVTNQTDNQTLIQLSSEPHTLGKNYFMATDYQTIDAEVRAQLIASACQETSSSVTPIPPSSAPSICSSATLDLAFVVDRSGSICRDCTNITTCDNWISTLEFVHGIVQSLSIGENQTRVGMIVFSSVESTKVLWDLTTYTTQSTLLTAIDGIAYETGGTTYTNVGLNLLTAVIFNGTDRQNVNKTAIIITDGYPTDNTTVQAAIDKVHAAGIKTLVVGVTNLVAENTLKQLSSSPQKRDESYFMAADFNSLATIIDELQAQTCGA